MTEIPLLIAFRADLMAKMVQSLYLCIFCRLNGNDIGDDGAKVLAQSLAEHRKLQDLR